MEQFSAISVLGALPAIDHRGDQIFPMDGARPSNSHNVQNHKTQRHVRKHGMEVADCAFLPLSGLVRIGLGLGRFRIGIRQGRHCCSRASQRSLSALAICNEPSRHGGREEDQARR